MVDFNKQSSKLLSAVSAFSTAQGSSISESLYNAALPLLYWLDYLRTSEATGCADEFLDGVRAAIVETTGCLALGLIRPAIFSLRGQIDLVLCWLYFKDHPIEWQRVQEDGEGFMLKRDVLIYLEEYIKGYKQRYAALTSAKVRNEVDPYKILSAHVHGQSALVIPTYKHLDTLVCDISKCEQGIQLQAAVTEYLSDILLAVFADKWASLPDKIINSAKARLGENIAKAFR